MRISGRSTYQKFKRCCSDYIDLNQWRNSSGNIDFQRRGGTSLGSARSQARARGVFARLEKLEARRLGSTLREKTDFLQMLKKTEKSGEMVIFQAYFFYFCLYLSINIFYLITKEKKIQEI